VKRSGFAAAATLAATLAFGVSGALAASLPGSPLTNVAAHDGVSVPSSLAHAIGQELGAAPAVVAGGAGPAQTQQQELEAPDGVPGDFFGETVSLTADGHTALVGAPFRTVGAAYLFTEQGGKWRLEQELQSPAGSATDTYGYSVALSGDGSTALLGAYSGGSTENGVVYSYALQGGRYVLNGQITAPDGAPGDEFGASVSLSGWATSR
jgi:FG-GAP repeat